MGQIALDALSALKMSDVTDLTQESDVHQTQTQTGQEVPALMAQLEEVGLHMSSDGTMKATCWQVPSCLSNTQSATQAKQSSFGIMTEMTLQDCEANRSSQAMHTCAAC